MDNTATVKWMDFTSVLGKIYVASTKTGVCRISISQEPPELFFRWLSTHFGEAVQRASQVPHHEIVSEMQEYLEGHRKDFRVPLHFVGTEFQRAVWDQLLMIPYGSTTTYGDVAKRIGHPDGQQAVGGAVGANPLPIVVPCHRVVGSESKLHGYAAGVATKEFLLRLEGVLLL